MNESYQGFGAKRIIPLVLFALGTLMYLIMALTGQWMLLLEAAAGGLLIAAVMIGRVKIRRLFILLWLALTVVLFLVSLVNMILRGYFTFSFDTVLWMISITAAILMLIFYMTKLHPPFLILLFVRMGLLMVSMIQTGILLVTYGAGILLYPFLEDLAGLIILAGLLVMDLTKQIPFKRERGVRAVKTAGPEVQIAASLEALDSALANGYLTEEEYRRKREDILNRPV